MTTFPNGEVAGLRWYEIPKGVMPHGNSVDETASIVVVCPRDKLPTAAREKMLRTSAASGTNAGYLYTWSMGFTPCDFDKALPGRTVIYDQFYEFDMMAWARTQVDIPATVDIRFEHSPGRCQLHVIARTMKNGRMVDVRRKVPASIPFPQAMAPILAYFERNCARVEGQPPEFSCGAHVAKAITHLDPHGALLVGHWLDHVRLRGSVNERSLDIPGVMLPGTSIKRMTLKREEASNVISAMFQLEGGHYIEEDASGVTVTIEAQLPDTVRTALKGRSVRDVTGLDWTEDLTVRLVREAGSDHLRFSMRAASPGVAFVVPAGRTGEKPADMLDALGEGHARWQTIHESATMVLDRLDDAQIVSVLAMVRVQSSVDLTPFGHPGWLLRGRGDEIVVDACPQVDLEAYLRGRGAR